MSAREPLEIDPQACLNETSPIAGLVVGELVALIGSGMTPIVRWKGPSGARTVAARTAVPLASSHVGVQLALMFENMDASRPVVMGCLSGADLPLENGTARIDLEVDGQRMVIGAGQRLELRCGAASISLDCDGKVAIRGTQIVSHAEGINRIRGGSVHLN